MTIAELMKVHRQHVPDYDGSPVAPVGTYPELDDPPKDWDEWGPEAQKDTLKPLATLFNELKEWNRKFARDI